MDQNRVICSFMRTVQTFKSLGFSVQTKNHQDSSQPRTRQDLCKGNPRKPRATPSPKFNRNWEFQAKFCHWPDGALELNILHILFCTCSLFTKCLHHSAVVPCGAGCKHQKMGRKPRFCCATRKIHSEWSDSWDHSRSAPLRWWQPCRGRLCPLLGTLQMFQTLPASRALQSCGKQLNCDSGDLWFNYCKRCEVQELLGDTLIAGYCGDPTDSPRRAAENQRSGPQLPAACNFGAIAIWLRITPLCSIDLHYDGNCNVFHTEALTSQFQLPLPRCETPMRICCFTATYW